MGQQNFKILEGINLDIETALELGRQAFRLFNFKLLNEETSAKGCLVNEKGNSLIELIDYDDPSLNKSLLGYPVGVIQCTPEMAVLFTVEEHLTTNSNSTPNTEEIQELEEEESNAVTEDITNSMTTSIVNHIYRISKGDLEGQLRVKEVACGNFNITRNRIVKSKEEETYISGIFCFENSELQKIYWVDGINPLRYLNLADSNSKLPITDANLLSSNPDFKCNHRIIVERIDGGGVFMPGTILYAFTYYMKYGAETNIVDMTPIYYIGEKNRGVVADLSIGCSYKITIANPDTDFDFIRVYAIQRNSLNGTPIVKVVGDIKIEKELEE